MDKIGHSTLLKLCGDVMEYFGSILFKGFCCLLPSSMEAWSLLVTITL